MRYPRVTITGADERTNITELAAIDVEVGILYSAKRAGIEPRYPTVETADRMTSRCSHVALHVCGSIGREEAIAGKLPFNMDRISRIQVNGRLTDVQIEQICFNYPSHTVITQMANPFGEYLQIPRTTAPNHAVLMDESGGNGEYPTAGWRRPNDNEFCRPVGFAGGIGPDNVTTVLEELAKRYCIAFEGHRYNWWIDMEAKVRDENDWLDLGRVRAVQAAAFGKLGFEGYFRRIRP